MQAPQTKTQTSEPSALESWRGADARHADLVWIRWLVWLAGRLGLDMGGRSLGCGGRDTGQDTVWGPGWDALLEAVARERCAGGRNFAQYVFALRALRLRDRGWWCTRQGHALWAKSAFCLRFRSTVYAAWRRLFATFTDYSRTVRGNQALPCALPRQSESCADPPSGGAKDIGPRLSQIHGKPAYGNLGQTLAGALRGRLCWRYGLKGVWDGVITSSGAGAICRDAHLTGKWPRG